VAYGIAVDSTGSAYVAGSTQSSGFPVINSIHELGPYQNTFVTKLNPDGTNLVYSTFLGEGYGSARGIAVSDDGKAYVTGYTRKATFPTLNPFQLESGGFWDAFVIVLNFQGR
jgi:hypothetical protein